MKLSIFIVVLAVTGMCCEAALKAPDKGKTCALAGLRPSSQSFARGEVGHSDSHTLQEI